MVARIDGGWQLLQAGRDHLVTAGIEIASALVSQPATELRQHLTNISDPNSVAFLEECVQCFERRLLRSAAVTSWSGAVWLLQNEVIKNHLKAFNEAGIRRFGDAYRPIKNIEGFSRLQEADLLQLLEDTSVIGKPLKKQLSQRLDLRNVCGHPNTIHIDVHQVAAHIEFLMRNIYERYAG